MLFRILGISYLILSGVFCLNPAWADEIVPHAVQSILQFGHEGTSSFYQMNGFGARISYAPSSTESFELNEFSWHGVAQGDTFSLNRLLGAYVRNFSDFHFEATGGLAQSKFAVPETNLLLEKTLGEYTTLGASASNSLFTDLTQTGTGYQEMIRGPSYQVQGATRLGERVRISAFHRQHFFSDQNSRIVEDFSAFYGISPDWPWIWVGAGVENLLTNFQTPHYWSPLHFITVGPRADITFPLTESLTLAEGLSLNRFDELGGSSGIGYYSATKLTWKRPKFEVSLALESILSEQNSNQWTSNGFRLEGTWLF